MYDTNIRNGSETISINGLISLPFLRCFGAGISNLHIGCNLDINANAELNALAQHISRYCAHSLTSLNVNQITPDFPVGILSKEFLNVKELNIKSVSLDVCVLPGVANKFPNVHDLSINVSECGMNIMNSVNFSHLRNVDFCMLQFKESLFNVLKASSQLQIVKITIYETIKIETLLDSFNFDIPSIRELTVHDHSFRHRIHREANTDLIEILHLAKKFPFIVHLNFKQFIQIEVDVVIAFIRECKALETFKFQVEDRSQHIRLATLLANDNWQIEYQNDNNTHIIALHRPL